MESNFTKWYNENKHLFASYNEAVNEYIKYLTAKLKEKQGEVAE